MSSECSYGTVLSSFDARNKTGKFNADTLCKGYFYEPVHVAWESEIRSNSVILNSPFAYNVFFIMKKPAWIKNFGISDCVWPISIRSLEKLLNEESNTNPTISSFW